jgi:uncharacterized protein (DUF983 family)
MEYYLEQTTCPKCGNGWHNYIVENKRVCGNCGFQYTPEHNTIYRQE